MAAFPSRNPSASTGWRGSLQESAMDPAFRSVRPRRSGCAPNGAPARLEANALRPPPTGFSVPEPAALRFPPEMPASDGSIRRASRGRRWRGAPRAPRHAAPRPPRAAARGRRTGAAFQLSHFSTQCLRVSTANARSDESEDFSSSAAIDSISRRPRFCDSFQRVSSRATSISKLTMPFSMSSM